MYISDRKTSDYMSQLALITLPWLGIAWGTWGWILEIVLLLSVLWIGRSKGVVNSALLLLVGYGAALIYFGASSYSQMGYVPFAGLAVNIGRAQNWKVKDIFFLGLALAGLLGAAQMLPFAINGIDPKIIENLINTTFDQYKAAGILTAMQQQGLNEVQVRSYIETVVQYYFLLIPALAALTSFIKFSIVYIIFNRIFPEKEKTSFSHWQLPWYAVWGAIFGIAAYLIGDEYKILFYKNLGLNLISIYAGLSLVLGASIFVYFLSRARISPLLKGLLVFSSFLYLYFTVITLVLFGLLDIVLNFRRIPDNMEVS